MVRSGAPKRLWDDCLEREAYVRSLTAHDIGPAMTRKVLKDNGKVVYRSTVRSLTPDELADETMKLKRKEFTEKVN